MIRVILTNESFEGEPGPNLVWQGQPDDFLAIVQALHALGKSNGTTIRLNNVTLFEVPVSIEVVLTSVEGRVVLNQISGTTICMELDCRLWRRILVSCAAISFEPSHEYIDFDDQPVIEDANFIIRSESNAAGLRNATAPPRISPTHHDRSV